MSLIDSRSMCQNHIYRRKSSLKDSVWLCRTQVFKTRDLYGIVVSNSSSTKRVFKSRVSKTWDASLLKPFKCVLTYYILSPYYTSLKISPYLSSIITYFSIDTGSQIFVKKIITLVPGGSTWKPVLSPLLELMVHWLSFHWFLHVKSLSLC